MLEKIPWQPWDAMTIWEFMAVGCPPSRASRHHYAPLHHFEPGSTSRDVTRILAGAACWVLPQESVRWMVEWVNGLWFQWTKWIYVSFQYISFISMEFNGLMLWPWRHPQAEAELCRQRDATKAWRSCAAEGSCSIAQQRQQALRRGFPWEKHGKTWGKIKTMWLFTVIWQEKWWVWECKWLWRICYMV